MINPGVCKKCGVAVNDLEKHIKRNRCEAQHIRGDMKDPRGKREYGKREVKT